MKKFTKIVSLLLVSVMMLTMLTACGGKKNNGGSSGYPSTGSITVDGKTATYSKNFSEKSEIISGANYILEALECGTLTADSSLEDKAVDALNVLATAGTDAEDDEAYMKQLMEQLSKKGLDYNKIVVLYEDEEIGMTLDQQLALYPAMLKEVQNISVSKIGLIKATAVTEEASTVYVGYLG